MSAHGNPDVVTSGLVLHLDAADIKSYPRTGTVWVDRSGNGNNGTLVNSVGYSNGAMVFDGVNDYALISSGNTSINPTTAITFASFFNIASYTSNYAPIIFKQNNYSGSYEQYSLFLTNTNIGVAITGINRVQRIALASGNFKNTNIYAVGTCDTDTDELKFYINGTLIQTISFTSTFDIANTPINIGGTGVLNFGSSYTGWVNGKIYSASIYNRALSPAEILQNYNATKSRFQL